MTLSEAHKVVDEINALSTDAYYKRIVKPNLSATNLDYGGYQVADMQISPATNYFNQCFRLIETTSVKAYKESTRGWHPKEKKEEMADQDMHYLIVLSKPYDDVLGFASYMFTIEDDYPVVYLYELHLEEDLRGKGLGAHLIGLVESFGRSGGMEKAMLTVFSSNEHAERLYRKRGYVTDEYSPQPRMLRGGKVKKPDYYILSKSLSSTSTTSEAQ